MALTPGDVRNAITQIGSASTPSKLDGYRKLQDQILSSPPTDDAALTSNLKIYAESILGDALSILQSRPILTSFVDGFAQCKSNDAKAEAGQHILDLIAPRVASFEEQDLRIKRIVADALIEQEDFSGAAKVLQTINLDSAQQSYSANDKAAHWLRIVRCYLEENEPENAVAYINRIKGVLLDVTDRDTRLHFLLSQARILDSQRSFLEASAKYYDTSLETAIQEDDRLQALSQSIICAVLAPAGPQRAAALAKIYKDERSKLVEEYGIMEKIFFNRLLSPEEVKAFSQKLQPHQLARTSDGSTVLDKAVLEHNLLAASRLYRNIYTKQLAKLLNTDEDKAEIYASQMIEQGRLSGYIDQIEGLIFFEGEGSGEKKLGHVDAIVGREQAKRDENIESLAERVEAVASLIQERYPEITAQMVH
ncbi:COP9 signalosome-like protein complex subunit 4 [Microthyrium microscopicum]|uniref:COP9 signalosome complex subunit 4 n=1 Tax=Microthyrium microscopicum TaxID=703497 RepID=A0A6A6URZ7_9PEZI|nr:COP9 signalosome-like protein complex subunit 4 [Microthyrium microscopicum]